MCFLKSAIQHKHVQVVSAFNKVIAEQTDYSKGSDQESIFSGSDNSFEKNQMMSLLGQLLQTNTACLYHTFKELNKIQDQLQSQSRNIQTIMWRENDQKIEAPKNMTIPPFLEQIFARKNYPYQLRLQNTVQSLLYKERNFNIDVSLVDASGKQVRNNNLISVYFAVCSNEKEWIHENRQGQPLIKGKNEVELFHGKGQFQKVYLRDVTKPYPGQKFNFVIYAKPSVVKMVNNSSIDMEINSEDIMPLLIQNITVLAKKKNNK